MENKIITSQKSNKKWIIILCTVLFVLGIVQLLYVFIPTLEMSTSKSSKFTQNEDLVSLVQKTKEVSYEGEYFICAAKIDDKEITYSTKNNEVFQIVREQCLQIDRWKYKDKQ